MSINFTHLLIFVAELIIGVITYYVVPYFKAKTKSTNQALDAAILKEIFEKIGEAVHAAEKKYPDPKTGDQKHAYVVNYIQDFCDRKNFKVSVNDVLMAIENYCEKLDLDKNFLTITEDEKEQT